MSSRCTSRLYHKTQALLGYLFGLDTSDVSRQINGRMSSALLSEALPVPARDEPLLDLLAAAQGADSGGGKRKHKKGKKIGTLEEPFEKHPEVEEIFVDATEEEEVSKEPEDEDPRKGFYGGERKRRTAKMRVLSTRNEKLVPHLLCRHVPRGGERAPAS